MHNFVIGYCNDLEDMVKERTLELATANNNMEHLLHQILPPTVAMTLARGETVFPEEYQLVTIFFSDVVSKLHKYSTNVTN